jgi:hypothetical protein
VTTAGYATALYWPWLNQIYEAYCVARDSVRTRLRLVRYLELFRTGRATLTITPEQTAHIELVSCRDLLATSKMLSHRAGSKSKAKGCKIK